MKLTSEQQHLSALRSFHQIETVDIYKACVAGANNGLRLPEEHLLGDHEKSLLEARRKLFVSDLKETERILNSFLPQDPLLNGDRLFLLGQIYHRKGKQKEASDFMNLAAVSFQETGDLHRALRAKVNGALCLSSLESCLFGDLYALELEARRQNFLDIAGNICRTRGIELLIAGRPNEAHAQALEASSLYQLDGFQDDRAVALLIAALAQLTLGDFKAAKELRSLVLFTSGKIEVYAKVYDDILMGKIPKIPKGHALEGISWKKLIIKSDSVTGKIIEALREGPLTRDELITLVWGENALDDSYCRRLYTAINSIRKDRTATIIFDGERYSLV